MFKKYPLGLKMIVAVMITAFILIVVNYLYVTEIKHSCFTWSKDGKKIFYVKSVYYYENSIVVIDASQYGIYKSKSYVMSMNPNGSGKRELASFKSEYKYDIYEIRSLKITPNGKELVILVNNWSYEPNKKHRFEIFAVGANGKNLKKLVSCEGRIEISDFFISPDSKKIVYTKSRNTSGGNSFGSFGSTWLVNIDGSNDHMICGEDSDAQGWTSEGDIIISWHEQIKEDQLWVYNLPLQSVSKKVNFRLGDYKSLTKSLGLIETDSQISPDCKKGIFYYKNYIGVMDKNGRHKKYLLKDIKLP